MAIISFFDDDCGPTIHPHDDPMVITAVIADVNAKRVLVDRGSSADILFYDAFCKMEFSNDDLRLLKSKLVSLLGEHAWPKGYVKARLTLGVSGFGCLISTKFIVIDCPIAFNAILSRPTLNAMGAIVSTSHLVVKFIKMDHRVVSVRGTKPLHGATTTPT